MAEIVDNLLAKAIRDLGSRNVSLRQKAEWYLLERLEETTPALIASAEEEARKRPAMGTLFATTVGVGIGTAVVAVIAAVIGLLMLIHVDTCSGGCVGDLGLSGIFDPVREAYRWTSRRHQSIVKILTASEEVQVIPALLTAYRFSENGEAGVLRRKALNRLETLLPKVEAGGLPQSVERQLHALLYEINPKIVKGTLAALRQIGGRESLIAVERYIKANGGVYDPWGRRQDLLTEAILCRDTLQERLARQDEHDTMLRASERPDNADTLLRPTFTTTPEPAEQLLRPSSSNDDSPS